MIEIITDISLQAAMRALDTMTDFAAKKNPASNLTKFVVAGASKVRADSTLFCAR